MRYSAAMGMRIPVVAAMIAFSASAASAAERTDSPVSAVRFDIRASAHAYAYAKVGGRIINTSARVGADLSPPAPNMIARRTTVSAADGRFVPALVYDFE